MQEKPSFHERQSGPDMSLTLQEAQFYLDYLGRVEAEEAKEAAHPAVNLEDVDAELIGMLGEMDNRLAALYEADPSSEAVLAGIDQLIKNTSASNLRATEKSKYKKYYKKLQEALAFPDQARAELNTFYAADTEENTPSSLPDPEVAQPHTQQENEQQAREDIERKFASDLVDDIVSGYKNETQIHGDTRRGFGTYGNSNLDDDNWGVTKIWTKLREAGVAKLPHGREEDVTKIPVELVAFTPATEPIYSETIIPEVPRTLFKKKIPERRKKEEVGKRPMAIKNALTGETESAVYMDYTFNPSGRANQLALEGKMPRYEEIGGTRLGNMVALRIKLPASVAANLKETLKNHPDVVRELLDKTVLENADGELMNEMLWTKGNGNRGGKGRPSFEELPENWKLFMVEPSQSEASYILEPISFNKTRPER